MQARGAPHVEFFLSGLRGGKQSPPRAPWREIAWAWIGRCLSIACLAGLESLSRQEWQLPLLIGSFGASAVLAFGAPQSPLAQPRNLVGGHIVSALVGVSCRMLWPEQTILAACLAVSTAIALMHAGRTLHPPGGATALIAVIGGESIHALGYWHVLLPCATGALCMPAVALITNNIASRRRYPLYWR